MLVGKVTGRCPEGLTSPASTAAMAAPSCSPGYQASTTAPTLDSHGITTGPSVLSTTTVWGLAAAKASKVAVVFAADYSAETFDRPNLSLPGDQDALIAAVAAANPHT